MKNIPKIIPDPRKYAALTTAERTVLHCLAEGLNNQEIAQTLNVSINTVKTHIRNILRKLQVSDRTKAAVYAIRCAALPKFHPKG